MQVECLPRLFLIMRCYIANDIDTDFKDCLIPGCYDGWHNDKWCTCYKFINPMKPKGRKKIENEIEELEKECVWLKSQLEKTQKKNHQLALENDEMRRSGLPLTLRRKLKTDPLSLYKCIMEALRDKKIDYHGY